MVKKIVGWGLLGIIGIFTLNVFFTYLGVVGNVATAPAKVINKTLQTDNIIQSYEWFYDVNAAYIARYSQVKQYKDILSSETDKDEKYRIRTELAAMQQTCRDLATKYNANSEKMNKSIFKGWELPATLSYSNC